eukprot:scaffold25412_cov64-Phaeocystis_antarctica.AAC.7
MAAMAAMALRARAVVYVYVLVPERAEVMAAGFSYDARRVQARGELSSGAKQAPERLKPQSR